MPDGRKSEILRIFLADDHPIVLGGIKAIVAADCGFALVGEANDGPTALSRAIELQPDVAVLDVSMPGMSGLEVARRLLGAVPQCRILILTMHDDAAYVRQVLEIGVAGYILKRSATEELGRAIRAVAAGGLYLDPTIAAHAVNRAVRPAPAAGSAESGDQLSAREVEVLRLAAAGHSNKTIAAKLRIGVKSVETYKARGMAKLGFESRVDVLRFAMDKGWLEGP